MHVRWEDLPEMKGIAGGTEKPARHELRRGGRANNYRPDVGLNGFGLC